MPIQRGQAAPDPKYLQKHFQPKIVSDRQNGVMAGLVPGIHALLHDKRGVDGRDKQGHDGGGSASNCRVGKAKRAHAVGPKSRHHRSAWARREAAPLPTLRARHNVNTNSIDAVALLRSSGAMPST
jgi:hypothetical protein